MIFENFRKFIKYFGKGREGRLLVFTGMSFIAGCLELLGVALVYPFILLIIQPEMLSKIPYIRLEDNVHSGLLIGFSVLTIFLLKNAFIIFSQYAQNKFVHYWQQDIANQFLQYYLFAPYKASMKINQTEKLYIIETVCTMVINAFILRCMNLLTNSVIVGMIVLFLFFKFKLSSVIAMVFIVSSLIIQNKILKRKTAELSLINLVKSEAYKKTLHEAINNLKDIKVLTAENYFFDKVKIDSVEYKKIQTKVGFVTSIPPYLVEIFIVCTLLVMAFIISIQTKGNNTTLIASYAIVVAAIFRIAPALNRIQSAIIGMNSAREYVKKIVKLHESYDLGNFRPIYNKNNKQLDFQKNIEFKNIHFSYDTSKEIIKNVSLTIEKGDFIGIIGLSGAGKSTLVDILTGMLPIDKGEILVDNLPLTPERFAEFRNILGYVPQQINILDKSIKENVAWGCEKIDEEKVIYALKAAQLYDVIKNYNDGINANIITSSNGLSQGQKQRLAIARALYRDPEILILDEATSALDVQVENEITKMLNKIRSTKTIIAIAHRLSTLKACNKLIYMKDGMIIDIGTFEELGKRHADFDNLLKLSKIN